MRNNLKLITCNIWGGIVYEKLLEFIKEKSADTDVFCFQEVLYGKNPGFTSEGKGRINIFQEISSVLKDFTPYNHVAPCDYFQYEPIDFGIGETTFVKNNLLVKDSGGFQGYEKIPVDSDLGGKATGNCQWVELEANNFNFVIVNVHGLWQRGRGKSDTIERITQSNIIKEFLSRKQGKKIICGDLNLMPEIESMKILEKDMRNLIKENGITSTRSSFYPKEDKFADYILVSPDVDVVDFKVLQDQVSDHLPLLLTFR
jgi:endonuclease/exonuclease/phosphatase family metal-dependent hydrolase